MKKVNFRVEQLWALDKKELIAIIETYQKLLATFFKETTELEGGTMKKLPDFMEDIDSIITKYTKHSELSLDGDEVDILTEHVRNAINLHQGNISDLDFTELEDSVKETVKRQHTGYQLLDFIERNNINETIEG